MLTWIVSVVEGLALWLLAIAPGVVVSVLVAKATGGNVAACAFAAQACYLASVVLVIASLFGGRYGDFGFAVDYHYTLLAVLVSTLVSLPLGLGLSRITRGEPEPPFLPERPAHRAVLMFALAPASEEAVFRGLVEGFLLQHVDPCTAVAVPAVLFALGHLIPYSYSKRMAAAVSASALILGLVAGHFRMVSGSLLPAIASHAVFNAVGYHISKRDKSGSAVITSL